MKQQKLLGYVFGYKDSEALGDNKFSVKFYSGISKTFPSKYKNKKDFYSEEVRVGDYSEIYCDSLIFMKQVFDQLKTFQEVDHEKSWQEEMYEQRKYTYKEYDVVDIDSYLKLEAISYVRVDYSLGRVCINLEECVTQAVATLFNISYAEATSKWNKFQEASVYIYEEETKRAIGCLSF